MRGKPWKRDLILRKYRAAGGICPRCKARLVLDDPCHEHAATLDHLIPFSKGGTNHARNLCLLCRKCNMAKGAEVPSHLLKPDGSIPRRLLKNPPESPQALVSEAQRALEALAQHRAERPVQPETERLGWVVGEEKP